MTRYQAKRISRLIRRFGGGGKATLARLNNLTAMAGAPSLVLAAPVALNDVQISISAPGLGGSLAAGFPVAIDGDPQAYLTTEAADVSGGTVVLPIAPLATKASGAGAGVTVPTEIVATFYRQRDVSTTDRRGDSVVDRAVVHLAAADDQLFSPRAGDTYRESGYEDERVAQVFDLAPGSRRLAATVHLGEAA